MGRPHKTLNSKGEKECLECKEYKPLVKYYNYVRAGRQYYLPRCMKCHNEYTRNNSTNRTKAQNRHYNRNNHYCNLTLDDVDKLWDYQEGICFICDKLLDEDFKIDHSYKTGKVRGLTHHRCNILLGWIEKTDEATLIKAFEISDHSLIVTKETE